MYFAKYNQNAVSPVVPQEVDMAEALDLVRHFVEAYAGEGEEVVISPIGSHVSFYAPRWTEHATLVIFKANDDMGFAAFTRFINHVSEKLDSSCRRVGLDALAGASLRNALVAVLPELLQPATMTYDVTFAAPLALAA